jgi:hypothetical protein
MMFGVTEIRDTPEKWQVVGGQEHFAGRIIRVRTDEVLMPNGDEQEVVRREYVEHPGAVGTVALDDVPAMLTTEQVHEPDADNTRMYQRTLESFIDFHDRAAPFYDALKSPEKRRP